MTQQLTSLPSTEGGVPFVDPVGKPQVLLNRSHCRCGLRGCVVYRVTRWSGALLLVTVVS